MRVVLVQPTYNEKENIQPLVETVASILPKITAQKFDFIQLIVDDTSPDGTGAEVKRMQKKHKFLQLMTGQRQGLGTAYTRGIQHAMHELGADVIVMMDADLQHDPKVLPEMLAKINQGYDVIIGSRYVKGGSLPETWGRYRIINSKIANFLARQIAGMSSIHDCTSGYRVIRVKGMLDRVNFDHILASGYSFLLMLLASLMNKHPRVYEYPIDFTERLSGDSKVGANSRYVHDIFEFLRNAWLIRLYNSRRLAMFLAVGLVGTVVNLAIFRLLSTQSDNFFINELIAGEAAILTNFWLNHRWTFKSLNQDWLGSLWRYHLSALVSVLIAATTVLFLSSVIDPAPHLWYVLVGIGLGAAWNYFVSSRFIWIDQIQRRRNQDSWFSNLNLIWLGLGILIAISIMANLLYVNRLIWFSGDEGRDLLMASQMIESHKPLLQGSTTNIHTDIGNFYFSPLYWYMLAAAYVMTGGVPAAGVYMQVGLFLLSLPLLYSAIKTLINDLTAKVFIALYVMSAYVVGSVNRHAWNPNPTPAFTAALLFSVAMLYRKKQYYLILLALSLSVLWQLDYAGMMIFPTAAVLIWYFWRQHFIQRRVYILSVLGFVITSSPLLVNELRYNFPNLRVLWYYIVATPKHSSGILETFISWSTIFQGFLSKISYVSAGLAMTIFLIGLVGVGYQYYRSRQTGLILAFGLSIVPLISLLLYPGEMTEHYFLIGLFAPFLVAAYWLAEGLRAHVYGIMAAVVILALYLGMGIHRFGYLNPVLYRDLSTQTQLSHYLQIADQAKQIAQDKPIAVKYIDDLAGYPKGMEYILKYKGVQIDPNASTVVLISSQGLTLPNDETQIAEK